MHDVNHLSFATLRAANVQRLPQFKNAKGELAHNSHDGSDWSLNDWMVAVTGEVGELANMLKKVRRGDYTPADQHKAIADELADVVIYLDILAYRLGVDLDAAVIRKWNAKSQEVGSKLRIYHKGVWVAPTAQGAG